MRDWSKLDPTSAIQTQLDNVNTNHEQLKSSFPRNQWSNSRNITTIFQKKRSIWFSIGLRDQNVWFLHVLGSITSEDTQQKLLQDPYIYKSVTCWLQGYILVTIDPKDATKNSLTLLLVCDYLIDKEPTDEEIN